MTLLVFIAVFAVRARSQTEHSIGTYTTSETERCVCQPQVTINPPVCGRSVPVNSGTGCNSTAVQEILQIVSSEQQDMRRQLEMLQSAVSFLVGLLKVSSALIFKDCSEVLTRGLIESGVYTVKPFDFGEPFQVYCDMETDGGGWTVFQRRQDGSVDFYLDFASYSRGFGNLEGEFWLGNDNLHRLTAQGEYELRFDLTDFGNSTAYAVYGSFSIADVSDNYRLTLGSYSGTAGDSFANQNNQAFTTKDRDNDAYSSINCAQRYRGAWWYRDCYLSNLNGRYFNEATSNDQGIKWRNFSGYFTLKTTEMKMRRKV